MKIWILASRMLTIIQYTGVPEILILWYLYKQWHTVRLPQKGVNFSAESSLTQWGGLRNWAEAIHSDVKRKLRMELYFVLCFPLNLLILLVSWQFSHAPHPSILQLLVSIKCKEDDLIYTAKYKITVFPKVTSYKIKGEKPPRHCSWQKRRLV